MNTNVFRKIARESEVAAMREGRILRAVTFTNRKRAASKTACRGTIKRWDARAHNH